MATKPASSRDNSKRFVQQVHSATSLPFSEAEEFLRKKAIVPTNEWKEMQGAAHDKGFTVAGLIHEEALQRVFQAVQAAIEGSETVQGFTKTLKGILDDTGAELRGDLKKRARTIYETNLRTSRAAGRLQQLKASKKELPFWRYRHGRSRFPRSAHKALDGKVLRADDPLWKIIYPPNGWGCSCTVEAISQRELDEMGGLEANQLKVELAPSGLPTVVQPGWDYQPGASADPYSGEVPTADKTFGGRQRLEQEGRKWEAKITPDEAEAVLAYTDYEKRHGQAALKDETETETGTTTTAPMRLFEEVNSALRGNYPSPDGKPPIHRAAAIEEMTKNLTSAISKFELPMDVTVFRGSTPDIVARATGLGVELPKGDDEQARMERVRRLVFGLSTQQEPGFSDRAFMSTSVSSLESFDREVVLEINLKKGSKGGAFVKPVSETPEQDEFLIKPGARFIVERATIEWRDRKPVALLKLIQK
ncbi:MAG: hypothetical protein LBM75_09260 [Myxococcales bacterium]|jgi:hypothetical protein|nr:hypothetical protein [Myxococcales bacterium]